MTLVRFDDGPPLVLAYVRDDGETRVKFTEVRPRGWVSDEVLRMADLGHLPRLALDGDQDRLTLTVTDDYGHRFVYRVRDYDPALRRCTFWMEWPD